MSDDSPLAPFVYEGLDPVPEPKSTIAEVSEAVKGTVNRVRGAIKAGRKPGMPLSILSNIAREATDAAVSYAKDAYENSGDTFRDGSHAMAKRVQDNPLGSMLIAGVIGFALALLMTRPPRRPPPRRW